MRIAIALIAGALLGVAFTACPTSDCANTPSCENNQAQNCVDSCTVGPCSTGFTSRDCGDQTCEVLIGDPQSTRFSHARAVCAVDTNLCDPATAPPPQCDQNRNITGCSAYKRNVTVSCAQAAVYFTNPSCCTTGINEDAGVTDAGVDAGTADAGTDGGP